MRGLLAGFASREGLLEAVDRLRRAGIAGVETHTPLAVEEDTTSLIPLAILAAGVAGAGLMFLLQWYATASTYPINVGHRPQFSWPAYVPLAFEFGVLSAVAAGVFGFLFANRLPSMYEPIDESDHIRRASRDGFFVAVRSADGAAIGRARAVLMQAEPATLEELAL